MSTSDSCKDGASKSNDDDVCDVNDMLNNMNTTDDEESGISVCANCGKEGNCDNMNTCNKCKQVKYCNAACKKKHRHKHKKQCERWVVELHDEELFKQPPPKEDCPICFVRLPLLVSGSRYMSCCGKDICSGCVHAPLYDNQGNKVDNKKCPFCRTPAPTDEEAIERLKKRVEANDGIAIYNGGGYHLDGRNGFPQDYAKALELWHRAGELGCANAYRCVGYTYMIGRGVEMDKKKAIHYYELAACSGDAEARYNLGVIEHNAGNFDREVKHFMIAVGSGSSKSLGIIKELYSYGHATKEDYMKALRLYQEYLGEIKSVQRDRAAAFNSDNFRYY